MDSIPNITLPYFSAASIVGIMTNKQASLVLTANRTRDGAPAYMAGDGTWASELACAVVYTNDAAAKEALARAASQEHLVCDPYLMTAAIDGGVPRPESAREWIRSAGPSSRVRRPDPGPPE